MPTRPSLPKLALAPPPPPPPPGPGPLPADRRARAIEAMVQAIGQSSLGARISTKKVRRLLDDRFERFCDGRVFDFTPIYHHVLGIEGVSSDDCADAIARLRLALELCDLELSAPELKRSGLPRPSNAPPPKKARALGALLLEARIVTEAQLDTALRHQASFGGRLGSHLLKMGCLADGALAHFLGMQLNLPAVDKIALRGVARDVLRSVPAELVRKHRAIPVAFSKGALKIAMVDPRDQEALREIGAHCGHKLLPMVGAEALIEAVLEEHFGSRSVRPRSISVAAIDVGDGEDFQVVHTSQRPERAAPRSSAPPPSPLGSGADLRPSASPPAGAGATISVENRGHFFQAARPDLISDERKLDDVATDLGRASDAGAVARIAGRMMATRFEQAIVFVQDGAAIVGAAHHGAAIPEEELRKIRLHLEDAPLFARAAQRRQTSLATSESSFDRALLASLGLDPGVACLCLPIGEEEAVGFVLAMGDRQRDPRSASLVAEQVRQKSEIALKILDLKRQLREVR